MTISLNDAGKRYNREWIFRHLSFTFETGKAYAITGPNGSGKSTLLQAIGGSLMLSEGSNSMTINGLPVKNEDAYQYITIAAPYLEVIEEMTATEFLDFHSRFKKFLPGFTIPQILQEVKLEHAAGKQIRYYSSGMKQRIKLAQAIFSDVPVILLDEPCSNLDADGIMIYKNMIRHHAGNRLVLVSSNDKTEYEFCNTVIPISNYK